MRCWSGVGFVAIWLALGGCHERGEDELKARVEARLRQDQTLPRVDVSTHDHVVVLNGLAGSEAERMRVEQVVRTVPHVGSVDNRLAVQQPPELTAATEEARLGATIHARLAELGFDSLDIEVTHRVVRVTGEVSRARHGEAMRIVLASLPKDYRLDDATTLR